MACTSALRLVLLFALVGSIAASCSGEVTLAANPTRFLVCNRGEGSFHGRLPDFSARSGVTVTVEASRKNGFDTRSCQATLSWRQGETLIGSHLEQADIDVMGADLGFGVPVVAFQIKATAADPTIRYEIYSLQKPPKLLRAIAGEDYFSAADTQMDGTVEIWTTDVGAIRGFDGLPRKAFAAPPAVVLRFEQGRLMDVSPEYRAYFDRQIQLLRSELVDSGRNTFKASDGRLAGEHLPVDGEPDGLLATKVRVLEIVWDYLNSGRATEAWSALDEMWPASDVDRVRVAMLAARKRGLASQVDGVSERTMPSGSANSSYVFSGTTGFGKDESNWQRGGQADTAPRQILVRLPSPADPAHWNEEKQVEVVIDEAGKVRSAWMAGKAPEDASPEPQDHPNREWLEEAAGWKYIPAFKDGHPAAFRARLRLLRDR